MGSQLCRTCPIHLASIFTSNAPFGFQIQSSLSDPQKSPFPIDELASLKNKDKTMTLALEYLHDDQQFASVWQSDSIHPETRRWMRKFIQIQTINAVLNGFDREKGESLKRSFFIHLVSIDYRMGLKYH